MSDPTKASWIVHAGGEPTAAAVRALAELLLAVVEEQENATHAYQRDKGN